MTPNSQDDQFDFNPNQYVDGGRSVPLPLPGEYEIRAVASKIKTDKDGNVIKSANAGGDEFRTVTIQRIEITDPQEDNGQFALFEDVGAKPFSRASGKTQRPASRVMDNLRAIDINLSGEPAGWDDAADVLLRELQAGSTFNAKLGYRVLDIDGAKKELEALGQNATTEQKNEVWRKNTYYTSHFRNADGSYNTSIKTPGGKILEPKLKIESFVPSNKRGKTGAFQFKPKQ